MPGLRIILLLLALWSGGFAHASQAFDDALRASDEELDRMRGGFVVDFNGKEFLLPFSIDGIERLTQVGGQTFINGELISPKVNVQAVTPLAQVSQALGTTQSQSSGTPDTPSSQSSNTANTQVTTLGSLIVIQNGAANSITLPLGVSPDSLATIIQNSVNDQIIRNITTLNIAVEAQMLAAQARLNALAQSLRGLH